MCFLNHWVKINRTVSHLFGGIIFMFYEHYFYCSNCFFQINIRDFNLFLKNVFFICLFHIRFFNMFYVYCTPPASVDSGGLTLYKDFFDSLHIP